MTKLATMGRKLSGVLAHEYEPGFGFCRKTATVTMEAGMDIGAVLRLNAGKWVWVAAADVASLPADVAVLIETAVDVVYGGTGDKQYTILFRGPSAVVDKGLLYKDTLSSAQKTTVQTALEGKGIMTRAQA
jgi:hypothetical protein